MGKNILILSTTGDFLKKFEKQNVDILKKMGYTVHYAANMDEPKYIYCKKDLDEMGVKIHHISISRSPYMIINNKKALFQIIEIIKRYDIKIIHCHTPVGGVLGRIAGMICKGRVVIYTAHGFHFYKGAPLINRLIYYNVEKLLAKYTDIIVVINKEDYENAKKFKLKKGGMIYKIPGEGIDTSLFKIFSCEEKNFLRKKYGIKEDEIFFISIGELNENKNHKVVIDALSGMKNRKINLSKIKYWVYGDGFLKDKLERYIKDLGLENIIKLCGYKENINEILGCADATVLPSKREGLGMAGLESLAMGVPLIVSDNRGFREYIVKNKNGFVCKCGNVNDYIESMIKIIKLSYYEREKMKIFCRNSALPFDKCNTRKIMEKIYLKAENMVKEINL